MEQKAKRIGKLNIIDLIAIVLIVAVLALNFTLIHIAPGDPVEALVGEPVPVSLPVGASPGDRAERVLGQLVIRCFPVGQHVQPRVDQGLTQPLARQTAQVDGRRRGGLGAGQVERDAQGGDPCTVVGRRGLYHRSRWF